MSVSRLFFRALLFHYITITICSKLSGLYIDNGFDQTIVQKMLNPKQKETLKKEMLTFFDLPEEPVNVPEKPISVERSAPLFLMDIYKTINEDGTENLDDFQYKNLEFFDASGENFQIIRSSDTIVSFAAQNQKAPNATITDRVKRLWFDVSQILPEDEIISAELRLYRSMELIQKKRNRGPITIQVFRITTSRAVDGSRGKVLVDTVDVTENNGWVVLNITESLHHWVYSSDVNRGLLLSVHAQDGRDHQIKPEESGIVGFRGVPDKQPFMVAYFKKTKQRRTRSLGSFSLNQEITYEELMMRQMPMTCKKENLYINFKDLNWQSWVIAPSGYDAHFCHGECNLPVQKDMEFTNHALVMALIHLKNPTVGTKACCVPNELSTIQVIYNQDNENYVLKNIKDMTVKSCGCH